MQKLKKWFINLSIQRKLLYCTVGISLILILSASLSLYIAAARIVTTQTRKQSAGVIEELSVNLDHYFQLVENSFDYIANNNVVQEELESDEPYRSDGTERYSYYSRAGQIRRLLLQGYTSVYMKDIQLYGYNGANHLLSNERQEKEVIEETVCSMAEEANGSCVYYYDREEDKDVIYIAKQIKDALTMEPLGILRASIKVDYLEKMAASARESLAAQIFLLDEEKQVIFNNGKDFSDLWGEKLTDINGSFKEKADGKTYNCVYQKSVDTGFILVGMIPMSVLEKTAGELKKIASVLIVVSIVLCIILTKVLARGIAGPIEQTSKAMKRFAGGDFTVRLPEGRTDEIGSMNSVFNHTIEEIERLLKQLVEMETTNKDIEFQALQAQINPHFLYNVLDTINWMARKKGEEKICHMVTAISSLMRASISNKKSMVTVREEIKYIQDYLYIQETRYGDRFTSYIEVDEILYDLQIPKMTIQTLVENSVIHGVENATWDCFLLVAGVKRGNMAVFTIEDNGVGMTEEKLTNLFENTEERKTGAGETHTRLGIYAVKKRMDYVYHKSAEINIESEEGKGTKVVLRIPFEEIRRTVADGTSGNDIR